MYPDYGDNRNSTFNERLLKKTKLQPCDKVLPLYLLNTEKTVFQKTFDSCERPFVVIPVANSNLVLVVIDALCPFTDYKMSLVARDLPFNESLSCYKTRYGTLSRSRKPVAKCINAHEDEDTIELCGHGERVSHDRRLLLMGVLLALLTVLGQF